MKKSNYVIRPIIVYIAFRRNIFNDFSIVILKFCAL